MSKIKVNYKPQSIKKDINLKKMFDTKSLDKKINICINKIINFRSDDFKLKNTRGEIGILKSLCQGMKDNHEIIQDIYKEYYSTHDSSQIYIPKLKGESKILCTIPLIRTQLECVYTVALLLQKPRKMFKLYIKSSWEQFYQKLFYEFQERKKISRERKKYNKLCNLMKNDMLSKNNKLFNNVLKKQDLLEIEKKMNEGSLETVLFPTPGKALFKLHTGINSRRPLVKILKRLYVEYKCLSGYTHGNEMLNFARTALELPFSNKIKAREVKEKEIVPMRYLDYLSILIVITDIFRFVKTSKTSLELGVNLNEGWNMIEDTSFLGNFVWENWAKKELGVL